MATVVGPRLQGGYCLPLGAVGRDRSGRNGANDLEEFIGVQTRDDKGWQKRWAQRMAGRVQKAGGPSRCGCTACRPWQDTLPTGVHPPPSGGAAGSVPRTPPQLRRAPGPGRARAEAGSTAAPASPSARGAAGMLGWERPVAVMKLREPGVATPPVSHCQAGSRNFDVPGAAHFNQ